jgi:hypothetical protein
MAKIQINVARKLRTLGKSKCRKRFLPREEYATLLKTIETCTPGTFPTTVSPSPQGSGSWSSTRSSGPGRLCPQRDQLVFDEKRRRRTVPRNSIVKTVLK